MRRALVGLALLTVVLVPTAASAQSADGTFASPSSAAASTPIFVRSVTPCPAAGLATRARWVAVWTVDGPTSAQGAVQNGEVRPDGSWDVTITAPAGPPNGATTYWFVDAECYETSPDSQTVGDRTQTYAARPLRVTSGAGTGGEAPAPQAPIRPGTTTTTAAAPTTTTTAAAVAAAAATTTTTTSPATTTTAPPASGSNVAAVDPDDIQAELDAKRRDAAVHDVAASVGDADTVLRASPAASQRPDAPDAGIPGWAFLCAAMLAVGAVIAWGAARAAASAPGSSQ